MHVIRRSALRAAASPSTSFIASAQSISTSTPFVLRASAKTSFATSLFRRAYGDESYNRSPAATDGEQNTVNNAVDTAEEGAPRQYQSRESRPYSERSDGYGGGNQSRGGYGSQRGGGRGEFRERAPREYTPRDITPNNTIYVGNLFFDIKADDLSREFGEFGTIKDVIMATDARGLSKGFGYIEFETVEQASAAIEAKNQTVLEGRRLVVNYQNKTTRDRTENPPSKTLFIGNLAFEMSDADLNKLFRDFKDVVDVRVAIDRRTGQPRGFAHADFTDVAGAVAAKEVLSGKDIYGRKLRVDFSAGSRDARGISRDS